MATIVRWRNDLAPAFEALNREWIERWFTVEEGDRAAFADPRGTIIEPGGEIFFVLDDAGEPLGTCALIRHDESTLELAKMAVSPRARGRGYGDLLMHAAIDFARGSGAEVLMLVTNSALAPALGLYEKHGFRRVPLGDGLGYTRADVQMELSLRERSR